MTGCTQDNTHIENFKSAREYLGDSKRYVKSIHKNAKLINKYEKKEKLLTGGDSTYVWEYRYINSEEANKKTKDAAKEVISNFKHHFDFKDEIVVKSTLTYNFYSNEMLRDHYKGKIIGLVKSLGIPNCNFGSLFSGIETEKFNMNRIDNIKYILGCNPNWELYSGGERINVHIYYYVPAGDKWDRVTNYSVVSYKKD